MVGAAHTSKHTRAPTPDTPTQLSPSDPVAAFSMPSLQTSSHTCPTQTILSNAAHGVPARALYLFPTKALAQVGRLMIGHLNTHTTCSYIHMQQDQLRSLRSLLATQPELAARVSVEVSEC